jgi:hypothetical protein
LTLSKKLDSAILDYNKKKLKIDNRKILDLFEKLNIENQGVYEKVQKILESIAYFSEVSRNEQKPLQSLLKIRKIDKSVQAQPKNENPKVIVVYKEDRNKIPKNLKIVVDAFHIAENLREGKVCYLSRSHDCRDDFLIAQWGESYSLIQDGEQVYSKKITKYSKFPTNSSKIPFLM